MLVYCWEPMATVYPEARRTAPSTSGRWSQDDYIGHMRGTLSPNNVSQTQTDLQITAI